MPKENINEEEKIEVPRSFLETIYKTEDNNLGYAAKKFIDQHDLKRV